MSEPRDEKAREVLALLADALKRSEGRIGPPEHAQLVRAAGLLGLPPEAAGELKLESPSVAAAGAETVVPGGPAAAPEDRPLPPQVLEALADPARHFGPPAKPGHPKYVVLRELGRGGMSTVYLAWQTDLRRPVALKVVGEGREGAGMLARGRRIAEMAREAYAHAGLTHRNILPLYEAGEHAGRVYLVYQYVEGTDLARAKCPSPRQAVRWVKEAAEGLAHAHAKEIVHRDVKPENVLVGREGDVYVMDFGVAAVGEEEGAVGTPAYMAPEQARGERVDARADVYGLGATLYYLLTGAAPHAGGTMEEVRRRAAEGRVEGVRARNPKVDAELEAIVMKALERKKEKRYATARQLAEELGRYLEDEPVEAVGGGAWYRMRKRVAKRKVAWALGTLLGVAVVEGGAGVVFSGLEARRREREEQFQKAVESARDRMSKLPGVEELGKMWHPLERETEEERRAREGALEGYTQAARELERALRLREDEEARRMRAQAARALMEAAVLAQDWTHAGLYAQEVGIYGGNEKEKGAQQRIAEAKEDLRRQ